MKIFVLADADQRQEIVSKKLNENVSFEFANNFSELLHSTNADAYFILKNEMNKNDLNSFKGKPVFINSVTHTLKELNAPKNIHRINGWLTFVKRDEWEIATTDETALKNIFEKLSWKYIVVKDEPGMIAARIIAMIVNEAYFALGDKVSTKDEIDVAMRLGTNYPYGPFEWAKKIGLQNIYDLLKKLSKADSRHCAAPAMEIELTL